MAASSNAGDAGVYSRTGPSEEQGLLADHAPIAHNKPAVPMGSDGAFEILDNATIAERDYVHNNSRDIARNDAIAPGSSIPKVGHIETPLSEPSATVQNQTKQSTYENDTNKTISYDVDYFATQLPAAHDFANPGSTNSPGSHSDNSFVDATGPTSLDPYISQRKDSLQHQAGSTSYSRNPRPTSVPNFQHSHTSRRREGPDYPKYPDQSFKALENQRHPPSHRPSSPHPVRTRSSHLSQSSSVSLSDSQASGDLPRVASGAKTVGNTPAQSPGLFTPTLSSRGHRQKDTEERRSNTPMLHPTHQKPPKETHKLLKDIDPISGRKTINHYEVLQRLGSGQHGTVKQGRDLQNDEMVAIKIVRRFSKKLRLGKAGDPNDMIKKEVAILKKARHPHVVSLIEVIDDDEFGKVYLILEFVERGEIIWRKETDQAIAAFEMARSKREIEGTIDEAFERLAVAEFNDGASSRRLEKARLYEIHKCQAQDQLKTWSSRSFGQSRSDFWSLELQPQSDSDIGLETSVRLESGKEGNLQPVQGREYSSQSQSPSQTPKPYDQVADSGSAPASVPSSRPRTPAPLDGTMWGPYVHDNQSDNALQAALNEIIAGETNWTREEEDFRFVPCLTLNQALDAFRDTVLGLEYLHYQGIIHRDIKPANLLWTHDYRVKISDFGVSYLGKPIREDDNHEEIPEADTDILDEAIELAKTVGTPAFYAPELCDPQYFDFGKNPDRPAITGQIDVWALGVTLYGMIYGRLPFFHQNEFQMYERIAREEVIVPRLRLKGVEHTDKTPSNHNKRLDDVLEYEDVDDELRDLLRRLLDKHPSKRITLKEVKHHPWVLRGIGDQMSWMDETDPSVQSQGRKIEVSTQDVQDAVVGLTLVDRVKASFQRVGSVFRGRGSRKRAESNPKYPEQKTGESSMSSSATLEPKSAHSVLDKDARRPSLRGDEQIYSALRASRDNSEHPLAQSVAVSPELRNSLSFVDEEKPVRPVSDPQASRPSFTDRTLSTADSTRTIRPPAPLITDEASRADLSGVDQPFSVMTPVPDSNQGSSSSLGGIFGGAGRRFVNSMRSRERGIARQSPSQSSRSSSVERSIDDPHASPSLALSSAIASGHVDLPPALREGPEQSHHLPYESTAGSFEYPQEQLYRRHTREYQGHARRPTASIAAGVPCPPSPEDEHFFIQQRPTSAAESSVGFQISSSSDQILSGDSTVHSRIPSVVSGASSLSATVEESDIPHPFTLEKSISPLALGRNNRAQHHEQQSDDALSTKNIIEDEAGYNGEGEQDSDSEDEGLAMA